MVGVGYDSAGRPLAVSVAKDSVRIWRTDVGTARPLGPAASPPDPSLQLSGSASVSGDGHTLFAATQQGPVLVWRLSDGAAPRQVSTVGGPAAAGGVVATDGDGRLLAVTGGDSSIRLWDLHNTLRPALRSTITGLPGPVSALALAYDGSLLAVGTAAGTVSVYGLHDLQLPRLLAATSTGSGEGVLGVALSTDAHALAAGGDGGNIWLWNITDRAALTRFAEVDAGDAPVASVAFAPGGRTLAARSTDGSEHRWDTDLGALARRICADTGSAMTGAEWSKHVPGTPFDPPCT